MIEAELTRFHERSPLPAAVVHPGFLCDARHRPSADHKVPWWRKDRERISGANLSQDPPRGSAALFSLTLIRKPLLHLGRVFRLVGATP